MAPTGTETTPEVDVESAIAAYEAAIVSSEQRNTLLKLATRRLFREHDLTAVVKDSSLGVIEKIDHDGIRECILDAIDQTNAVVVSKDDYDSRRLHRDALTGFVLDKYPTKDSDPEAWDALDVDVRDAWKLANIEIWKLVSMEYSGSLQSRIRARGDGLMLVKLDNFVYLTGEARYIRIDVFRPRTDKLERLSAATGEEFGLWTNQVRGLKKAAAQVLNQATKNADAKAKAAFALSSSENGDAAESDDDE